MANMKSKLSTTPCTTPWNGSYAHEVAISLSLWWYAANPFEGCVGQYPTGCPNYKNSQGVFILRSSKEKITSVICFIYNENRLYDFRTRPSGQQRRAIKGVGFLIINFRKISSSKRL